ncbi:MAG: DNA-primase RepB domain-containing protein [Dehalococcoidia bacterium]
MVERPRGHSRPYTKEDSGLVDHATESSTELLAELKPFWHTIYGERSGLLGLFSGHRDGPRLRAPREIYFIWPNGVHYAADWLADEVAAGRDVYQCAHLLTRPRRRKQYAAPLRSLYVDLDRAELPAGAPAPSVVVESSPGRWQCYWPLTEPVDPHRGEDLNRRLAYAFGADRSGWDLTQLLRLPATPNRKYLEAPPVRLLQHSDVRFDPLALDESLPSVPTAATARAAGVGVGDATAAPLDIEGRLSKAAMRVMTGESVKRTPDGRLDRSASLVWMARVLCGAGASRPAIIAALAERDATLGWRKFTDRRDATPHYHRIVDVIERGTRPQRS